MLRSGLCDSIVIDVLANMVMVSELKEILKENGLPTTGTKNELIKRLLDAGITVPTLSETPSMSEMQATASDIQETDVSHQEREIELLRRERNLAVREAELLRRELDLERTAQRDRSDRQGSYRQGFDHQDSDRPVRIRVRKWQELKGMAAEYDGQNLDYDKWEKQVLSLFSSYELDQHEKKALLCSRLTGKVLRWYHSRIDCVDLNSDDLLREMKKMYGLRPDPLVLRREFEKRIWRIGETFSDYLHDKVTLGNRVPVTEAEMISYVIDGIQSKTLRTQSKIQRYESIEALQEAFANVPAPRETLSRPFIQREKMFQPSREQQIDQQTQKQMEPGTIEQLSSRRCYNCNEKGHIAYDCPKSKRERGSCYKCGKFGHRSNQCQPEMKEVNYTEEEDDFRRLVEVYMGSFKLNCKALLDSGSPISFIKKQFIPREYIMFDVETERYYGLNHSSIKLIGCVEVTLVYDVMKYKIMLRVVQDETMNSDLILGRDFMKIANLSLCKRQKNIDSTDILNIEIDEISTLTEEIRVNEDLPFELRMTVQKLFQKFYVEPKRPLNPATENILTLTLTDKKPFSCAPRRLSYSEKAEVRKIIDGLIAKGIIRESTSEYASPIVLVKKKTGETRMCVDFRKLNKVTLRDNFPLPLIEDQLDLLEGKKYFTSLDLKDGFFHIRMDEESIKYTSFVTPLGQYEYIRMPFGLKGAPLKFQRYVTQIFKKHIDSGEISIYMDDFLIATETIEHHLQILEKVFKLLVANRLELRLDKCQFMQTKLIYLGYTVTNMGIHPTDKGLEAVKNFPIPRNVRDVQSFLGMCSYFRKFVKNFSIIAKPLYDLTRKNVDFKFNETEERAFHELKDRLIEAPILSIYSPRDNTELHCDASAAGFGAILLQRKFDGKLHPVFYFSKRTTQTESKYHSFELETLSIIYALRRFRTYLFGLKFKIVTDCQALSLTLKKKETNPRIARWVLELENYDYSLEHRSGSRMLHVDALSRQIAVVEDNSFDRNLAICQSDDLTIMAIRNKLQLSEDKFFEMRDGLIYRKYQGRILFYVPVALEKSVIHKYHNEMGHVGVEKSMGNILNNYWFPEMKTKVDQHIKNCLKCIAYTPITGKQEGSLHSIPKGNTPFDTLHIDHLAPSSRTFHNRVKYIFVVIDAFTKYIKLYSTRSTNSSEVIKCLKSYFSYYSRPLRIISDRGSCFTSREFEEFMKTCNVQHIKISTASPQANGQVERVNRTILPMIAKLADERNVNWSDVLEDVEFACNNSNSKATNECPSVLLYGVHQRGKVIDHLKDALELERKITVNRDLEKCRKRAENQIIKNQEVNKRIYDTRHKAAKKYKVGDKVMVRNFDNSPGVSPKMIPRFKGPYEVDRVLRNDRYVLKDIEGFQLTQIPYFGTWEASNMRAWTPG